MEHSGLLGTALHVIDEVQVARKHQTAELIGYAALPTTTGLTKS